MEHLEMTRETKRERERGDEEKQEVEKMMPKARDVVNDGAELRRAARIIYVRCR